MTIKKAIIPVAGFGTRMYPATKVINKELMPLIDRDGLTKPALLIIIEELIAAEIEEICLIIRPEKRSLYDKLFSELDKGISNSTLDIFKYEENLKSMRDRITYAYQEEALGLGDAVLCSADFASNKPVLLSLGDYVYESLCTNAVCAKQLITIYNQEKRLTISLSKSTGYGISNYGVVHGAVSSNSYIIEIDKIWEKPIYGDAIAQLNMGTKDEPWFLTMFGQYILTPQVFKILKQHKQERYISNSEIQLTAALEALRELEGATGFIPNGICYDIGNSNSYRNTMTKFGRSDTD